jgi:hypothetical protein
LKQIYLSKDAAIEITIEAYFKDEQMVIEGYDVGKTVNERIGRYRYEYSMSLPQESVQQVDKLFNIL